MSARIRAALVAVIAVFIAAPAAASANSVTTGKAESYGSSQSIVWATSSNTCDAQVSWQWGTSPDALTATADNPLTTHPPGDDGNNVDIGPLTPGTTYYYRAILTSPCGNAEGAVRCFVHSATINDPENAACPNDPGDGSNTGTGTGTGTGDNSGNQDPGYRRIHPKGHDCQVPIKIGYVLRVKAQGKLKCRTIMAILDTKKARKQIGWNRVAHLYGFTCTALNHNGIDADYHCKHGHKGWYMHTYADTSYKHPHVPGEQVYVDY